MNEQIKVNFDKIEKTLNLSKKNISLRKKNFDQFKKSGFPNKKKEDWKFSDLNKIISHEIKELQYFDDEIVNEKSKIISFVIEDSIFSNIFFFFGQCLCFEKKLTKYSKL